MCVFDGRNVISTTVSNHLLKNCANNLIWYIFDGLDLHNDLLVHSPIIMPTQALFQVINIGMFEIHYKANKEQEHRMSHWACMPKMAFNLIPYFLFVWPHFLLMFFYTIIWISLSSPSRNFGHTCAMCANSMQTCFQPLCCNPFVHVHWKELDF